MEKDEIIKMLKEMQIETAKCQGFVIGHVAQAWVISDLLGKKIEELGGQPYIIQNDHLVDVEEKQDLMEENNGEKKCITNQ